MFTFSISDTEWREVEWKQAAGEGAQDVSGRKADSRQERRRLLTCWWTMLSVIMQWINQGIHTCALEYMMFFSIYLTSKQRLYFLWTVLTVYHSWSSFCDIILCGSLSSHLLVALLVVSWIFNVVYFWSLYKLVVCLILFLTSFLWQRIQCRSLSSELLVALLVVSWTFSVIYSYS